MPMPLNQPGRWDFFISHTQRNPHAVATAEKLSAPRPSSSIISISRGKRYGYAMLWLWLDVDMDRGRPYAATAMRPHMRPQTGGELGLALIPPVLLAVAAYVAA